MTKILTQIVIPGLTRNLLNQSSKLLRKNVTGNVHLDPELIMHRYYTGLRGAILSFGKLFSMNFEVNYRT